VIEDGRLGRAGGARVVMAGDRVQELRRSAESLESAKSEMDMAEEATLICRREDGRPA
jgi:hypothetical protein